MKVVLIDDDVSMRETLRTLIDIYTPQLDVAGEASGVSEGLALIDKIKPDVVLLDVEMQDGTGFDLLSKCGDYSFKVIFVTGHDAYAIKAFKYSAVDYVLKPIDPEDLIAAVNKASENEGSRESTFSLSTLLHNQKSVEKDKKIVLKDSSSIYLITVNDIVRCQSEVNYTRFFLVDGREILISKTLKEYDTLFKNSFFFRAHQSHLINLHHFDRYEKANGGVVYMKDGSTLPVAIRKKEQLIAALEGL